MLLHVLLVFLAQLFETSAFLYQPSTGGQIWDPSVTYFNGTWWLHAMYQAPGDPTNSYKSGWLATSSDGAHWRDGGAIATELPGDQWWKGFVRQIRGGDEPLFVMDHGVYENGENDALRFLMSTDLKNWKLNSTSHPDPRWYNARGRWDHMYMREDTDKGGFVGFAVSSPIVPGFARTWPAVQRSPDGIRWETGPPLNVSWNGVQPQSIEEGGFEAMRVPGEEGKPRFYLIGGGGGAFQRSAYSMWTFEASQIDGPYTPAVDAFRLSGGSGAQGRFGWLAAWCGPHCDGVPGGTPLISNYMTPTGARSDVWMLPMRQPVVDEKGRLRLAYFAGNDALRGESIPVPAGSANCASSDNGSISVTWLAGPDAALHANGVIWNATLSTASASGSVGVALEDVGSPGTASTVLLLKIGGDGTDSAAAELYRTSETSHKLLDRSARFACGPSKSCGVGTVTGFEPSKPHTIRVMLRRGMFEAYLDDLLVQTYVYGGAYPLPNSGVGRIGVACSEGGSLVVRSAEAWRMAL